jgi:hypothetical protein
MSPILTGVIASGISGHLTPPWSPEGGYDSLATVTVPSGGAAMIEFAGIPSGYKHLELVVFARLTTSNANQMPITFNGDTSSIYADHNLRGNGSSASAGADINASPMYIDRIPGTATSSGTFGATRILILDYASSSKYKTLRALFGYDANGSGLVGLNSGLWQSLSPITSIKITDNYAQYSQFALYGVK